jgi:hypothetical protein
MFRFIYLLGFSLFVMCMLASMELCLDIFVGSSVLFSCMVYGHMLRCFILDGRGVVSFYYVYVGYGLLFIFILFYSAL